MKMILTSSTNPEEYVASFSGWRQAYVIALRDVVHSTAPELEERLKWGHLVYFMRGPMLLIRAERHRVLFGFFRGKRLRHIEPRLSGSGKYELASLDLREDTPFSRGTAVQLVAEAVRLSHELADPRQPGASKSAD